MDSAVSWRQLIDVAESQKLLGLLGRIVAEGLVDPWEEHVEVLSERLHDRLVADLVAERQTLTVITALQKAKIPHVVFKGAAHAHVLERDPAFRHFNDCDILVPSVALHDTYAVLSDFGAVRLYPEARAGFDERFGKGATFVSESIGSVDVHRMCVTGWVGAALADLDVFSGSVRFDLAGHRIATLSPLHTALLTSVRAIAGDQVTGARDLRDAVLAFSADSVDPHELIDLAVECGVAVFVAATVRLANSRFSLASEGPLADWARSYRPSSWEERRFSVYTYEQWSYLHQLIFQIGELDSTRARATFVRSLTLPDRESGRAPTWQRIRSAYHGVLGKPT